MAQVGGYEEHNGYHHVSGVQMLWFWRTRSRMLVINQEDRQSLTFLVFHLVESPSLLLSCQYLPLGMVMLGGRGLMKGDLTPQPRDLSILEEAGGGEAG